LDIYKYNLLGTIFEFNCLDFLFGLHLTGKSFKGFLGKWSYIITTLQIYFADISDLTYSAKQKNYWFWFAILFDPSTSFKKRPASNLRWMDMRKILNQLIQVTKKTC